MYLPLEFENVTIVVSASQILKHQTFIVLIVLFFDIRCLDIFTGISGWTFSSLMLLTLYIVRLTMVIIILSRNIFDWISLVVRVCLSHHCTKKTNFSNTDFFSKCDQIRSLLRIWSHFLKKSLMESFIFLCSSWSQLTNELIFLFLHHCHRDLRDQICDPPSKVKANASSAL